MKASFWSITKLKTISDTTLDCGKRWNAWNVVWVNLSLFYVLRPAVYENKFPYILLSTVYECNCTLCNFMHLYMQWYNIFHLCAYLMWSRNIKHMKKIQKKLKYKVKAATEQNIEILIFLWRFCSQNKTKWN